MEKIDYKFYGKVQKYERKFNLYTAIATVVTGVFTGISILLKEVLLIESGILLFTTVLTILVTNLILDLKVKSHSNSWIFASPPLELKKGADRIGKEICEHRPSLLTGDNAVSKLVSRFFMKKWAHFAIILPSFVIFYIVMVTGLIGYQKLGPAGISLVNFASDISWLFWFPLLWLLTWLANGRTWCQTCPFSGQAEWVHRLHPWNKVKKKLGLNLRWPIKYSTIFY
ncbi:MAG: 4Fe-4S binding protein, partial [Ignisphaera sp.]